jgi:hypothetical protein
MSWSRIDPSLSGSAKEIQLANIGSSLFSAEQPVVEAPNSNLQSPKNLQNPSVKKSRLDFHGSQMAATPVPPR